MVFSSSLFLFIFLPAVIAGYYIFDRRFHNIWLFLASLFFYSWGEPRYIILMLFSIFFNYVSAFAVAMTEKHTLKKMLLIINIIVNLSLLGYYKYFNFIIGNINAVAGSEIIRLKDIALPIGISFYTFQSMSYVIDVYNKKVACQKNIIRLGLYISLFPQLIAGPIVRYSDIEKQISSRSTTYDDFYCGCRRFMIGFSKKILLADQLAPFADAVFLSNGCSAPVAWTGAVAYALQIFFDFCGYSDMAIGIGRIFGFNFIENFNYPYISKSIREFWRRWHISLSSWFRDYVYIPLGGSRCSTKRTCFNLAVVFFLTGLWHGASWNFVVWGLYYVVFLIMERLFLGKRLDKCPVWVRHLYSILVILIGWVFFRADTLAGAFIYIGNMFNFKISALKQILVYMNSQYFFCIITGLLLSMPVIPKLENILEKKKLTVISDIFVILIFIVAISYLMGKGFSPFLYFRF